MVASGSVGVLIGFVGGLLLGRVFARPSKSEERMLDALNDLRAVGMATAAAAGVRRDHIAGIGHTQQMFVDAGVGMGKTRKMGGRAARGEDTRYTDVAVLGDGRRTRRDER